jgi:hypothetical protein
MKTTLQPQGSKIKKVAVILILLFNAALTNSAISKSFYDFQNATSIVATPAKKFM